MFPGPPPLSSTVKPLKPGEVELREKPLSTSVKQLSPSDTLCKNLNQYGFSTLLNHDAMPKISKRDSISTLDPVLFSASPIEKIAGLIAVLYATGGSDLVRTLSVTYSPNVSQREKFDLNVTVLFTDKTDSRTEAKFTIATGDQGSFDSVLKWFNPTENIQQATSRHTPTPQIYKLKPAIKITKNGSDVVISLPGNERKSAPTIIFSEGSFEDKECPTVLIEESGSTQFVTRNNHGVYCCGSYTSSPEGPIGKCTFSDGRLFEGTFSNNQPLKGKLKYTNGKKFVGDFKDGKPFNGTMKKTTKPVLDEQGNGSGTKIVETFEGTFDNNEPGTGTKTIQQFTGQFSNAKPHGNGTMTVTVSAGTFVNGLLHDENGTITTTSSTSTFVVGNPSEQQILSTITRTGTFENGVLFGQGKVTKIERNYEKKTTTITKYEKDFTDGRLEGQGSMTTEVYNEILVDDTPTTNQHATTCVVYDGPFVKNTPKGIGNLKVFVDHTLNYNGFAIDGKKSAKLVANAQGIYICESSINNASEAFAQLNIHVYDTLQEKNKNKNTIISVYIKDSGFISSAFLFVYAKKYYLVTYGRRACFRDILDSVPILPYVHKHITFADDRISELLSIYNNEVKEQLMPHIERTFLTTPLSLKEFGQAINALVDWKPKPTI